ncbi:cytochrome p450 [Moniliophthora roreri]|nr:cytochrome p450 [Moniliophthora roreri]
MEGLSVANVVLLILSFTILYTAKRLMEFRRILNSVGGHPGYRTILSGMFSRILPPIVGVVPGNTHHFRDKFRGNRLVVIHPRQVCAHNLHLHAVYEHFGGWDIIANVSMFPPSATLSVSNAETINDIVATRARFPKPVSVYPSGALFGKNIVASEGEDWKKYRKIAAPAFSDRNNKLVWDETTRIMLDLFEDMWDKQESITVDHIVDITLPIALFVIGAAGFGRRVSWQSDTIVPPGHQMTFKDALHKVCLNMLVKRIVPAWMMGFTPRLRKIRLAFEEFEKYMLELIHDRRSAPEKEERYDLFSALLDANDDTLSGGEAPLTERELMGNIFIFMLAGHETTAHTLAFAFGLLAFHQDEQELLYQHIKSVIPDGRLLSYEEMPLFTQSMAVLYETMRLFPPATGIPKFSIEDTTFITENVRTGEKKAIPVPRGAGITLNTVGLHYNPRYWKDPEVFKPSRFREDWPRDAFLPFSAGARACLGRKFFETEAVAALTMLVSRYKIEVKDEPEFAGETLERKKERLFRYWQSVTLAPLRMPLVFRQPNDVIIAQAQSPASLGNASPIGRPPLLRVAVSTLPSTILNGKRTAVESNILP